MIGIIPMGVKRNLRFSLSNVLFTSFFLCIFACEWVDFWFSICRPVSNGLSNCTKCHSLDIRGNTKKWLNLIQARSRVGRNGWSQMNFCYNVNKNFHSLNVLCLFSFYLIYFYLFLLLFFFRDHIISGYTIPVIQSCFLHHKMLLSIDLLAFFSSRCIAVALLSRLIH